MTTIAHISDLHFGHEEREIADALLQELRAAAPAVVVVSGDLTQRATAEQFAAARAFLDKLPMPWLSVPGNHDVPLYDVVSRFLRPFARYRRWIAGELCPVFRAGPVAVFGVNTAKGFTVKSGSISRAQLASLRRKLGEVPDHCFKIVVTHHPFIAPPGDVDADVLEDAGPALEVLDAGGADLLLAGHLHKGFIGDVRTAHPRTRSILAVQCGTSISTRVRGEPNAYNLIRVGGDAFELEVRTWRAGQFMEASRVAFAHKGAWTRVSPAVAGDAVRA